MGDILDEIVAHKQKEIEKFKEELPLVFLHTREDCLQLSDKRCHCPEYSDRLRILRR